MPSVTVLLLNYSVRVVGVFNCSFMILYHNIVCWHDLAVGIFHWAICWSINASN